MISERVAYERVIGVDCTEILPTQRMGCLFQEFRQWSAERGKRAGELKGEERSWKEEGNFALTSYLTPIAVFLFCSNLFAPSPRSDRLEQVRVQKKRGCMDAW